MLNKLCKILFISLFLITLQSYAAAPPPLPPSLPNSTLQIETKETTSDSSLSIFDKFKQFFHKPSQKAPIPQQQDEQPKQSNSKNSKLASQEPKENEATQPLGISNAHLPTANNEHNTVDTKLVQGTNENDATQPFMDLGSTPPPSVTNNEHNNEASNDSSTNLAYNIEIQPVTPNVQQPLVTMPPLRSGSYVVPPTPPVQIYKPINLPPIHIPTPLIPPPSTNVEQNNVTPPAAPSNTTPAITPVVNSPTMPSNTSTPTIAPPTPNTPPIPAPVINSPVVPNSTPDNLPAQQPVTTPVPAVPNMPTVPTTTDSSNETDNRQQTLTASANSSKKQDWNTPLKPVEVLAVNQSQNFNNTTSASTPMNQTQLQPQNISSPTSSSSVTVKKQGNVINNEVMGFATKFAKDESQMLLLPNDDIVLGKLTKQATLEQMDIYSYIKLFQKKEKWLANTNRRRAVESLVKYDNDLNKKKDIYATLSYCSAVDNAFKAIDKDNLSKLRVLLDIYPILQETNRSGETLLTAATYKNNYYLAKYLVIRGIKISTLNSQCQYPLDIALAQGNTNIACMLMKAKGYN